MQYTLLSLALAAQILPILASPVPDPQAVVTVVKTVTAGGPPVATKVVDQPKVVTITKGGPNNPPKSEAPPASTAVPSNNNNNNNNDDNNDDDVQANAAPDSDSKTILDLHAKARKCHGAGSMTWDTRLATAASQLAQTCRFEHNT